MKLLGMLILLFVATNSFAQSDNIVALRGTISIVSYYQGGAELPYEEMMPRAYKTSIWIVEYVDSLTPPKPLQQVESDSTGEFLVYLPPSKYGFVTNEELTNLQPGQILPTALREADSYSVSQQYWTSTINGPIELRDETYIDITYFNVGMCMECP